MSTNLLSDIQSADLWETHCFRIRFLDRCLGGTPADPKLIESWLAAKAGITQEDQLREAVIRTIQESDPDIEVNASMSMEELRAVVGTHAADLHLSQFKRDETGIYLESRHFKAALREAVNILFPGKVWGATTKDNGKQEYRGKAARSYFVERVHVAPLRLYFERDGEILKHADGVEQRVIHAMTPSGKVSSIARSEYVQNGEIEFIVRMVKGCLKRDEWAMVLAFIGENGVGATRSQDYGKFEIIEAEVVA